MTHLVRSALTKRGTASSRPGLWHLAVYGPTTLCGIDLDLSRVHRLDMTPERLEGPDVCQPCIDVHSGAVIEYERTADDDDELDELLAGSDADSPSGSLGTLRESRPAADTHDSEA